MNEQKKLAYGIVLDTDKLEQQSRYASKQFQNISDTAESSGNQIASSFKKIGAAVGIAFSTQQITQFIGSVVKMRGEIESLEISFATLSLATRARLMRCSEQSVSSQPILR